MFRWFVKYGLLLSAFWFVGCADTENVTQDRSYLKANKTSLAYYAWKDVSAERVGSFSKKDAFVTFKIGDKLDMDIYGCQDIYCSSATSVVIHDSSFKYVETLRRGEFLFLVPSGKVYSEEFGYDCEIKVAAYWDLIVNTETVRIDWNVQEAEESCEVHFYK